MCEKYPLAHKPTDDREILGKGVNLAGFLGALVQFSKLLKTDKMGRLISRRNQLNFFDSKDISTRNVIRHVEEGTTRRLNRASRPPKKKHQQRESSAMPRRSIMVKALDFF